MTQNANVRNREVLIVTAGTVVTIFVNSSGTDTATNKYMNLGRAAVNWVLRTDEDITIDKINGEDILQNPITLTADGNWTKKSGNNDFQLTSVTFTTNVANTTVRLYVDTW